MLQGLYESGNKIEEISLLTDPRHILQYIIDKLQSGNKMTVVIHGTMVETISILKEVNIMSVCGCQDDNSRMFDPKICN